MHDERHVAAATRSIVTDNFSRFIRGADSWCPVGRVQAAPVRHCHTGALGVGTDDYEIAWLYPATNTATWERFVAAMRRRKKHQQGRDDSVDFEIGDAAFPLQTTAIPEVAIRWRGGKRLVFRWYKLTSSSKTRDWVEALAHRSPPPLAVIGGGNSYTGLELARQMERVFSAWPEATRPLLLLTTATADNASTPDSDVESPGIEVNKIYPDSTFRFCFTNRQMAFATTRFLWQHDDLVNNLESAAELFWPPVRAFHDNTDIRPEAEPVFQVAWMDDSYSADLLAGYQEVRRVLDLHASLRDTMLQLTGDVGAAALPASGDNVWATHLPLQVSRQRIFSSVGTYHAPNQFESTAVHYLLNELAPLPKQRRHAARGRAVSADVPLSAIAGRADPDAPQRLVVVAGDTIAFNNIYRDRLAAWARRNCRFHWSSSATATRSTPRLASIRLTVTLPVPRICCCSATWSKCWRKRSIATARRFQARSKWPGISMTFGCMKAGSVSFRKASYCSTRTAAATAARENTSSICGRWRRSELVALRGHGRGLVCATPSWGAGQDGDSSERCGCPIPRASWIKEGSHENSRTEWHYRRSTAAVAAAFLEGPARLIWRFRRAAAAVVAAGVFFVPADQPVDCWRSSL